MDIIDSNYRTVIEKGRNPNTDAIHEFLASRISGEWLDIGCNAGWLLETVPGGVGVDASIVMVEGAKAKGLTVHHARAEALPFKDISFDCAVFANVLEQIPMWVKAVFEAQRVALRVIGSMPYPGTPWGIVGGHHKRVKTVIAPEEFVALGGRIERITETDYFFEL